MCPCCNCCAACLPSNSSEASISMGAVVVFSVAARVMFFCTLRLFPYRGGVPLLRRVLVLGGILLYQLIFIHTDFGFEENCEYKDTQLPGTASVSARKRCPVSAFYEDIFTQVMMLYSYDARDTILMNSRVIGKT